MSEQQDQITPIESASNVSRNRGSRPGKAQRAQSKGTVSQATSVTGTQSVASAGEFARRMTFTPTPQPGKYPIVFQTGAGEPTRDAFIAVDGCTLERTVKNIAPNYINSARYAEFSTHADYVGFDFTKDMTTTTLLGIAQQIVHAHVNMGLPLGDFSSVSSTEVYNPQAVRAIISQFGEFSIESLGTRYLYASYEDEVKALVRTANRVAKNCTDGKHISTVLKEHWLPASLGDKRTAFIVASKLDEYLKKKGGSIPFEVLSASIFTAPPTTWPVVSHLIDAGVRDRFKVLFEPYASRDTFMEKFTAHNGFIAKELDLYLVSSTGGHLNWDVVPKIAFPELMEPWLRKKATIVKFFTCGLGSTERAVASGSPTQLGLVSQTSGITVVQSLVASSVQEFSLMACFPATSVYPECGPRNVVLTSPVYPNVRATEFMQRDWIT